MNSADNHNLEPATHENEDFPAKELGISVQAS
jgi:hypothetical protein